MRSLGLLVIPALLAVGACSAPNTTSSGFLGLQKELKVGYQWTNPDSLFSHETYWAAGSRYADLPKMRTAEREGAWQADPGYRLFDDAMSPIGIAAKWVPGSVDPEYPNVHAANSEGRWSPDPGYRFLSKNDLRVERIPLPAPALATNPSDNSGAIVAGVAAVGCAFWETCRNAVGDVAKDVVADQISKSISDK